MRESRTSWLLTSTVQLVLLLWLLSTSLQGLALGAAIFGAAVITLLPKLALERFLKGRS